MSEDKKNLLDADKICAIIKQCGLSGVRALSYGGLKLTFGQPPEPPTTEVPQTFETTVSQTREAQIEDQAKEIARELDDLLINDPLEYERLIRSGELVDEKT